MDVARPLKGFLDRQNSYLFTVMTDQPDRRNLNALVDPNGLFFLVYFILLKSTADWPPWFEFPLSFYRSAHPRQENLYRHDHVSEVKPGRRPFPWLQL